MGIVTGIVQFLVALLLGAALWVVLAMVAYFIDESISWVRSRRRARIARIEAELDAREAELREAVLALAEQLADRDDASRALTRAAYLASGSTNASR